MRTEDADTRIVEGLLALADEAVPSPTLRERALTAPAIPRNRARHVPVLLAAAAVIVIVTLVAVVLAGSDDERAVDTIDDPVDRGSPWAKLPDAPIGPRIQAAGVWTGEELVVWGGSREETVLNDGASYDPETDDWRAIVSAPDGSGGDTRGVWTGDEALFFWVTDSIGGETGLAAYDPADDRWRELEPWPLGPRDGMHAAWTGDELIVVGGGSGELIGSTFGASYDPETDAWSVLPPPPFEFWQPRNVAWVAGELVAIGGNVAPDGGAPTGNVTEVPGAAYDPETGEWRVIADGAGLGRAVAVGDLIIEIGTDQVARYDPARDEWTALGAPPPNMHDIVSVVSVGERAAVLTRGGRAATVDPATGDWTVLPDGSVGDRPYGVFAWVEGALVVWGGQQGGTAAYHDDGYRYRPTQCELGGCPSVDDDVVDVTEVEHDLLLFGDEGISRVVDGVQETVWSKPVGQAFPDGTGGVVFQDAGDAGAIRWWRAGADTPVELADGGDNARLHGVVDLAGERTVLLTRRFDTEDQIETLFANERELTDTGGIESGLDAATVTGDGRLLLSTCHLQCSVWEWTGAAPDLEDQPIVPADWIGGLDAAADVLAWVRYTFVPEAGDVTDPVLVVAGQDGTVMREIELPDVGTYPQVDLSSDGRAAIVWTDVGHDIVIVDRLDTTEPRVRRLDTSQPARFA